MALTRGRIVDGRYRVVSSLGQGGMGAVYRAWDTRLNVPVALKEMIPQSGLAPQALTQLRQQFQQEATVLARLDHPHLVDVTDFFEWEGNVYLVMKFIEGESLADRIAREGQLAEPLVLAWGGQLLDALAYCHGQGVVHRDVKPQNVVISPQGQAVLVDFGLVKLWDAQDPRTLTVMRGVGTPEYAPPEQYDVAAGHTGPHSDVYSLGATLYHALTGQPPPTAMQRIASRSAFRSPRAVNERISPALEAVVLRAMELVVEDRFPTGREMASALREATPAPPRPAPPAPRKERRTVALPTPRPTVLPGQRRVPRWVWPVGGMALVAVATGIAIGISRGLSPTAPASETPVAAASPTPTTLTRAAPTETSATPTAPPTATPLVEPSPTPSPGPTAALFAHETADSEGYVGGECSLALDASGVPHVTYYDELNDSVKYAFLSGTRWVSQTVETSAVAPSLALDGSDNPHVAYGHRGPYVNYAVLRGAAWAVETAAPEPAAQPSIALDGFDIAHIAYCDVHTDGGLVYARWTGSRWLAEDVDSFNCGSGPGQFDASLALDGEGTAHIAYYDGANDAVKYAVRSGDAWTSQTLRESAGGPSLALDASATPHVAFTYRGLFVNYAVLRGSTWVTQTVHGPGRVAGVSLALDALGNPHVAYCDDRATPPNGPGEGLKYAYWTGSEWAIEVVEAIRCEDPCLALDDAGNPHISYHYLTGHDLKYAHRAERP